MKIVRCFLPNSFFALSNFSILRPGFVTDNFALKPWILTQKLGKHEPVSPYFSSLNFPGRGGFSVNHFVLESVRK